MREKLKGEREQEREGKEEREREKGIFFIYYMDLRIVILLPHTCMVLSKLIWTYLMFLLCYIMIIKSFYFKTRSESSSSWEISLLKQDLNHENETI